MRIILAVCGALVIALVFRGVIRKFPWAFYLVCGAVCAAYFVSFIHPDLRVSYAYALFLKVMQRGTFGFALLTVVMFVGVFPKSSWIRDSLVPIRRQLSIAGCMMLVPHIVFYTRSYLLSNVLESIDNVSVSLVLAGVLVVIGAVLFLTSFVVVRRAMSPVLWKRIQRMSYVFFGLTFVHLLLFLAPSAMAGRSEAQMTVAVYLALGIGYAVLRIARYALERKAGSKIEGAVAQ